MRGEIVRAAWALAVAVLASLLMEVVIGVAHAAEHGAATVALYLAMGSSVAIGCAALAALLAPVVVLVARIWARATGGGAGGTAVHALGVAASVFVALLALAAATIAGRFHDAALIGLATALVGLGAAGVAATLAAAATPLLRRAAAGGGRMRRLFAEARPALHAWLVMGWLAAGVAAIAWDAFALVFPGRIAAAATVGAIVLLEGASVLRSLVDAAGRTRRGPRIGAVVAVIASAAVLLFAADERAREAVLRGPPLRAGWGVLGALSDVDRDGYSSLLGGGDCAPFDGAIHPRARDLPGDGIDQNCSGRDAASRARAAPQAAGAAAAAGFNVLLVSIDSLRYEHTTPAGYARDTTPRLAELARRAAWCEQAHATGTLTRDSLPVLAAGRHVAELPLGAQIPGSPYAPRVLLPGATTLAEVLAGAGYHTAMFTAFWYFDRWQIAQGMEHVLNHGDGRVHGATPRMVSAAIEHLAEVPSDRPWFAWLHLLDPHVPYQAHPGFPSFGDGAVDRYDDDLVYADHHLGLLLDWVASHAALAARTVIVVTADHGEHLGEGGHLYHGGTLKHQLTRVPLVVHVPGMTPRRVATPISLIDLAPTIAALVGAPPSPDWTGQPQVAALLEGREEVERVLVAVDPARDRVVAITPGFRLHVDLAHSVSRLVDVAADPLEETDVSADHPDVRAALDRALADWRDGLAAP